MRVLEEEAEFGLKRVRAFRQVIQSGSTRAAASVLGVTQSAVSQQLKLFEEGAGEKLFIRDRRGLIPTTRAMEIYNKINRYFETLTRIENEIAGAFTKTTRKITIAVPHLLCWSFVPKLIRSLNDLDPALEFYVSAQNYAQVAQSVLTDEVDIGISRLPLDDRFFEWEIISHSKSVCLLPPAHPMADREEINLNDVDGQQLIILERELASHHTGLHTLLYEGRSSAIKVTDTIGFVAGYVSEGLGISIANEFIARQLLSFDIKVLPFQPAANYEYVVLWRRGRTFNFDRKAFVRAATKLAN